jgi:hypothetical protein
MEPGREGERVVVRWDVHRTFIDPRTGSEIKGERLVRRGEVLTVRRWVNFGAALCDFDDGGTVLMQGNEIESESGER